MHTSWAVRMVTPPPFPGALLEGQGEAVGIALGGCFLLPCFVAAVMPAGARSVPVCVVSGSWGRQPLVWSFCVEAAEEDQGDAAAALVWCGVSQCQ